MRALLWGLIALVVAAVVYESAATDSTVATCPNTKTLDDILAEIRTGGLTAAQAEKLAVTYDKADCAAAALAIRTAAALAPRPSDGLSFTKPTGGPLATKPGAPPETLPYLPPGLDHSALAIDRFGLARIPDPSLRAQVQELYGKNPCAWTNADFDSYDAFAGTGAYFGRPGRIQQSFIDRGIFTGADTLADVSALTDLSKQYLMANACRAGV